jgi:arsenite methyltransferase
MLSLAKILLMQATMTNRSDKMAKKTSIMDKVRERYGSVARSGKSSADEGIRKVAEAFGYSPEQLASIPAAANMGLSCGNPTATANLRPGEVVVDLGCGGGLDVLLAARKVGPTGWAIGIDMTPEMIQLARKNAEQAGAVNVEFHLARLEAIPLEGASVDCLISNCVLNLAEDKAAVFREMHRILKPGGRVAVSDIALKKPLPPEVAGDMAAYTGCIGGALLMAEYERLLHAAGFVSVRIIDTKKDLNAYRLAADAGCCGGGTQVPPSAGCCGSGGHDSRETAGKDLHDGLALILTRFDANEFAASVRVYAVKAS